MLEDRRFRCFFVFRAHVRKLSLPWLHYQGSARLLAVLVRCSGAKWHNLPCADVLPQTTILYFPDAGVSSSDKYREGVPGISPVLAPIGYRSPLTRPAVSIPRVYERTNSG